MKMKACLMALCYGAVTTSAFSPAVSSNRISTQLLANPLSRRGWFQTGAAAVTIATLGSSSPVWAAAGPPSQADFKRIQAGYTGIVYLLDNWDKETTTCRDNGGECKRDAEPVRRYLGLRYTTDPLFQIEKVFEKVKNMEIDPDKLDTFFEATEDWNSAITMSNSMAFISQFGEYNPGGGKDEVLKYLDESKKQVIIAERTLRTIMDCLDVKP